MDIKSFKENNKGRKSINLNIEKILFFSFASAFILMVVVQAMLVMPWTRPAIYTESSYEGIPIGAFETLYKEGEVTIEVMNRDAGDGLKVLVNGDEAGSFQGRYIKLKVKDGDVIEIQGILSNEGAKVAIASVSSNIDSDYVGKSVTVTSGIKSLARIDIN